MDDGRLSPAVKVRLACAVGACALALIVPACSNDSGKGSLDGGTAADSSTITDTDGATDSSAVADSAAATDSPSGADSTSADAEPPVDGDTLDNRTAVGDTGQTGTPCDASSDAAVCDSLAATFSKAGVNPVGAWSYGWSAALGGPFTLFTKFYQGTNPTFAGLPCWANSAGANLPDLCFNPGSAPVVPYGTYTVQPGQILAHPGPQGEYAIARWTAAQPGSYRVCARFDGLSGTGGAPPTTTDVHVQHSGSDLSHGYINAQGGGNSFGVTTTLTVASGDAIDFAVGYGNGNHSFDSTGIDALVCKQ